VDKGLFIYGIEIMNDFSVHFNAYYLHYSTVKKDKCLFCSFLQIYISLRHITVMKCSYLECKLY